MRQDFIFPYGIEGIGWLMDGFDRKRETVRKGSQVERRKYKQGKWEREKPASGWAESPRQGLIPRPWPQDPGRKQMLHNEATQVPHSVIKSVVPYSIRWRKRHFFGSAFSVLTRTPCVFLCSFVITEDVRNLFVWFLADGFLLGIFLCQGVHCLEVTYRSFLIPSSPL